MDKYDYKKEIYEERKKDVAAYVNRLGFKKIEYLQLSGYKGVGLEELIEKITELYVPNKNINTEIKIAECEKIVATLKILDLDSSILSAGYSGVIHIGQNEYEINIEKMTGYDIKTSKQSKITHANIGDVILVLLKRLDWDEKRKTYFKLGIGQTILLRHNETTIAFGKIKELR